ncbi:CBS domain-containing protein [Shewanella acanthi]|uniref:CBS domain-containing protein n=1 Tax=Shewanella acanthi TaxID=2864212 RepID=UPI001C65ABF0|nr:CBS domain-containing protein [Shewanella acanthi]QYJ79693.1 CBS domain-containing protein [Shewanella acanthi]
MPITIADIMSTRVVTVDMDDRLTVAKEIFEQVKFHHLLVMEDKQLAGILSERDLLRAISPHIGTNAETAKDIDTLHKRMHQVMTRHPITASPQTRLDEASRQLLEHNIGCLPVLENGQLKGIVTWKDLLRAYCDTR